MIKIWLVFCVATAGYSATADHAVASSSLHPDHKPNDALLHPVVSIRPAGEPLVVRPDAAAPAPAAAVPAPVLAPVNQSPPLVAPYVARVVHHAPAPAAYPSVSLHPAAAAPYGFEPSDPVAYSYGYGVSDAHSGSNFVHQERREGYATGGEYKVALPDGRTQIVTYRVADGASGFLADVRYEGEAHYPPANPVRVAPYA